MKKKILLIDFDGVLHSYKSGWRGIDVIPDLPVERGEDVTIDGEKVIGSEYGPKNSIQWLENLINSDLFHVNIYSSRSKEEKGIVAMKVWLYENGLSSIDINKLFFPTQKPPAFLTIDDRGLTFTGRFFSPEELIQFKTWQGV